MERFTMRITDNVYYTKGKYEQTIPAECESWDVREILKRLADYEDTGIGPEEIKRAAILAKAYIVEALKENERAIARLKTMGLDTCEIETANVNLKNLLIKFEG